MRRFVMAALAVAVVVGSTHSAWAAPVHGDRAVWVSGASPFGDCPGRVLDSRLPAGAVEPFAVSDPAAPDNMVAAWTQDRFRGVVIGVSGDAGRSWRRVVVGGLTRCTGGAFDYADNVWLSYGPHGVVYLSAHVFSDTGASARVAMRSVDGGRTWTRPVPVVAERALRQGSFSGGAITADPNRPGLVYSVAPKFYRPYNDGVPYRGVVFVSRSRDAGQHWEQPVVAFDTGDDAIATGHQILALPDRTLLDVFTLVTHPDATPPTKQVMVMRSADQGEHWSPPATVADLDSVGTRDPDRRDPGRDALVNTGSSIITSAAVDRHTGRVYIVWQDARFNAGAGDAIALSTSADGGRTWTRPVKVNATPTTVPAGDQQAFAPTVDVASDGTVAVSYYDLRHNDPAPPLLTDRWLVRCRPAALTSCTENRLTDRSFDTRLATNIDVGPPGFFLGSNQALTHTGRDFIPLYAQTITEQPPRVAARRVPIPRTHQT